MLVQSVNKNDSLENVINGKFVFCKELNKGFIKRDLSSLGLTDYSFENVVSIIETMTLSQLESNGLNSVIFFNGEEKISYRMKKEITKEISELPQDKKKQTIIESILSLKRADADYFDNTFIEEIVTEFAVSGIDVSVMNKILASDGTEKDYFGLSVAVSNTKIVVGAKGEYEKGIDPGSAYIYDLDGSNEIKLTASDGATDDHFGYSVDISDTKIVVGAVYDDDKGSSSGSAYIYDLDGTNEIKLTASDGAGSDYFGYSVAVSNSKVVVGAHGDDDKGSKSGSVYIYDLDGTNEIKLVPSDGVADDYFGFSVAVSDTKIVVGAPYDDDKGDYTGSVYIYNLDGTNEIKLTASDGAENDQFGRSVAVSDSKIVVGSYLDDDKGSASGSAYIYDLDGTNEIKLTASDGAEDDRFGYSVAVSDSKIVVGSYLDDDKGDRSGSAYIYDLDGSNEIKLTASDGAASDYFGFSVAVSDTKIVVGAYNDDDNGDRSGSAYIFG